MASPVAGDDDVTSVDNQLQVESYVKDPVVERY